MVETPPFGNLSALISEDWTLSLEIMCLQQCILLPSPLDHKAWVKSQKSGAALKASPLFQLGKKELPV
jgi:hypothetical protein